jgi:hypothetical protein
VTSRLRTVLIVATGIAMGAAAAVAQDSGARFPSPWTSVLTFVVPIVLLILVWLLMWKRIGLGKGGYRKLISENQDRMAQIESHLGEISRHLERIASSLERPGR